MTFSKYINPTCIFLLFLSLYLFTFNTGAFNDHFYSIDGKVEYEQMKEIVGGDLSLLTHPHKHLGLSLAEIPFYLFGNVIDRVFNISSNPTTTLLVSPVIGALVCFFVFLMVRLLSSQNIAIVITFLSGLGTLIWPYSKGDTTDSLFILCILAAVWSLLNYNRSKGQMKWYFISLIFMAATYVTKLSGHGLLLGWLFYIYVTDRSNNIPVNRIFINLLLVVAVWCLFLPISMNINKAHAQSYTWGFFHEIGYKIAAREFSPLDGLFWYFPLMIIALVAVRQFIKEYINEFILIVLLLLPYFIVLHMGKDVVCLYDFAGRYDIVFAPLILLCIIPFVRNFKKISLAGRISFFALAMVSIYIQFLGTAVSILYYANIIGVSLGNDCHAYIMSLRYSPLYVYPLLIMQGVTGIAFPVKGIINISGSIDQMFRLDYFWVNASSPLAKYTAVLLFISFISLGLYVLFKSGLFSSMRKYTKEIVITFVSLSVIWIAIFVPKSLFYGKTGIPVLIDNPGFEDFVSNNGIISPKGWGLMDYSAHNGRPSINFSPDTTDVPEGRQSLEVSMNQDYVTMSLTSERFSVKGGEIIECSCKMKSLDRVPATVRVALIKDIDPFYFSPVTAIKEYKNGWTTLSSRVAVPDGTKEAVFLINVWTGGLKTGSKILFDDVRIKRDK